MSTILYVFAISLMTIYLSGENLGLIYQLEEFYKKGHFAKITKEKLMHESLPEKRTHIPPLCLLNQQLIW
jgi:hypothetical protein